MISSRAGALLVGAQVLSSVACTASPATKVVTVVETMKAEQTAVKLLERGRAFASVGDYTRAEQYLAAAIDAGAPPHDILPLLLKVCVAERRYRAAIDYAEPELKKHPEGYQLRFVVASLYATIGETGAALKQFELVVQARPDHAKAHYALAVLLRNEKQDPVGADRHFREYLRLSPAGPHAEEARGSLLKVMP